MPAFYFEVDYFPDTLKKYILKSYRNVEITHIYAKTYMVTTPTQLAKYHLEFEVSKHLQIKTKNPLGKICIHPSRDVLDVAKVKVLLRHFAIGQDIPVVIVGKTFVATLPSVKAALMAEQTYNNIKYHGATLSVYT